tara:strand:- start:3196 stop:3570 length:375 start_codon:yes stop_codon:yes gene_type:complete
MPPIRNITPVTLESIHEDIPEYIHNNQIIIANYNDMKDVYLRMLKDRYLFPIDRDILIACLTDMTYMYCPGDDLNKDRVIELLELEGDDDDDDEDDDDDVPPVSRVFPEVPPDSVQTVSEDESC